MLLSRMKFVIFCYYRKISNRTDISRIICHHLVGRDYTHKHRKCVGVSIMIFGVGIYKICIMTGNPIVGFCGEVIGFAIHAAGYTPFAEKMVESEIAKENAKNQSS